MATGQGRIDRLTQMLSSGRDQTGKQMGAARMDALRARLAQLRGEPPATPPAVPPPPTPPAPQGAFAAALAKHPTLANQAGVQPGYLRTASGQTIKIQPGLVGADLWNAWIRDHPEANPWTAGPIRTSARLAAQQAAGQAAYVRFMQEQFGPMVTPERLAAVGLDPSLTADQLTNTQLNAVLRGAGAQQAQQYTAESDAGWQAFAASPEGQASGFRFTPTVLSGAAGLDPGSLLTAEQRAERFVYPGAQIVTPDLYATQNPNAGQGLLDLYRRAYEAALARYTAGGV